jgi:hypothetical protein
MPGRVGEHPEGCAGLVLGPGGAAALPVAESLG